ncbi:hypothetical protein [Acidovorax sp. 100]|uniref:hypothetical protein n=1 Tax=Acidovorax sp. 100 TaxID=2135635 RepID=UPI0011C4AA93|nr:hypothetical protein [Acidovorax sp. 100]
MDSNTLVGLRLDAVWLSRTQPHPAWVDASTPEIQGLFVNLVCAEKQVIHVVACEVEDPGKYPALGLEIHEVGDPADRGRWYEDTLVRAEILAELAPYLPATIAQVRLWDALGEGPDSALCIFLDNGVTLTVRNILPPMIVGVEISETS